MELLGIRHAALPARDLARAIRFYTEQLGFEDYHSGDPDWAMLRLEGTSLSLLKAETDPAPPPAGKMIHPSHLGLVVATPGEVDAMHARLSRTPEARSTPPLTHRDGSYGFYFRDSEGNRLECIFIPHRSRRRPAPARTGALLLGTGDPGLAELLSLHLPGVPTELARLDSDKPTLEEAAAALLKDRDLKTVHVLPLFPQELRAELKRLESRHPGVRFLLSPPLSQTRGVREALLSAAVDLVHGTSA